MTTDSARAEHTITYRHDRDTVTATFDCHAAEDADCRLRCEHPSGCEPWYIERDDDGPFHTVEAWDADAGKPVMERHPLTPAADCNAVEWLGNWDVHESGPYETFDIATVPVEPVWGGDGYTWKPAAARAETITGPTTADVEGIVRSLMAMSALTGQDARAVVDAALELARGETTTATTEDAALRDRGIGEALDIVRRHGGSPLAQTALEGLLATARTSPTREQVIDTLVMSPLSDTAGTDMRPFQQTADAVMALYGQQPTEAEVGARALEQVCDDLRNLSVGQVIRDGSSWIKLGDLLNRLTEHEDRAARLWAGGDQTK